MAEKTVKKNDKETAKAPKAKKEPKAEASAATAMKTLGNLSPARGKKRLGRGLGSGLGKTSARGGKGQTARKGGGIPFGFEGGQMPLYRRLPKRGFTNHFRTDFNVVNLRDLNRFANGTVVTREVLDQAGLLRYNERPVKLLGTGALERKLTVKLDKLSASAKAAVEKAGGKVEEK
jgi:large subunit ribosomal protein L15